VEHYAGTNRWPSRLATAEEDRLSFRLLMQPARWCFAHARQLRLRPVIVHGFFPGAAPGLDSIAIFVEICVSLIALAPQRRDLTQQLGALFHQRIGVLNHVGEHLLRAYINQAPVTSSKQHDRLRVSVLYCRRARSSPRYAMVARVRL
jgi:hypothetical protein